RSLELPIVASANCHTLSASEGELLRMLTAIRKGVPLRLTQVAKDHSFLSPQEMKAEFSHLPEAIANTVKVAERCNLDLNLGKIKPPRLPEEQESDAAALLAERARQGLDDRLAEWQQRNEYRQRLSHELGAVARAGLSDFFLIIADLVDAAKAARIPLGLAGGRAASSLLAYALGISSVDPVPHGLYFETFLNELLSEIPEVDMGLPMEARQEVYGLLCQIYGSARLAHIVSVDTMQKRTAIRDVGKALQLEPGVVEKAGEAAASVQAGGRHQRTIAGLALEGANTSSKMDKLLAYAAAFEGLPRRVSTHATGIVIAPTEIDKMVPLYRGPRREWVSQYDARALKRLGLIKLDLVGKRYLTVIQKTCQYGPEVDVVDPGGTDTLWRDAKSFAVLCRAETVGLPYVDTPAARDLLRIVQPKSCDELLYTLALVRRRAALRSTAGEGAWQHTGGGPAELLARGGQRGAEKNQLSLIFDEDLLEAVVRHTGWQLAKAELFCRRLQRETSETTDDLRIEFLEAVANNKGTAGEKLWVSCQRAAAGLQRKSDTVCRALAVLQCSAVKCRLPIPYVAAFLNSYLAQPEMLLERLEACLHEGHRILPPDINLSLIEFSPTEQGILFGLAGIRHVSIKTATAIVAERQERGPFSSLADLCARVGQERLGRKALETLIKSGALDCFSCSRRHLLQLLQTTLRQIRQGQMALFQQSEFSAAGETGGESLQEWDTPTVLTFEKEALGVYLSHNPLTAHQQLLAEIAPGGIAAVSEMAAGARARVAGIIGRITRETSRRDEPLVRVRVADFRDSLELFIFADTEVADGVELEKGELVLAIGRVADEQGKVRLLADRILPLEQGSWELVEAVHLHFEAGSVSQQHMASLKKLLARYKGKCPLFFHFHLSSHTEVVMRLPDSFSVQPSRTLQERLTAEFGGKCWRIQYGN
ncbi:MAG: DNA polymerase III subunit alpha, partial [Deltaproteobacteria bacterium]|nr:DNA polymerase III subunit alpha [Deltaproteobacteria bacterium]